LIPVSLAEKSTLLSSGEDRIKLDSLTYQKMMRFTNSARNLFRLYNKGVEEYSF